MASILENIEWDNAVNKLRQKATEFNNIYNLVVNSENVIADDLELYKEYDSIRYKGDLIKGTIKKATGLIDEVYSAASSIIGEDNTINMLKTGAITEGLGILPFLPIMFVTSAIAAITYWVNDAIKYLSKVEQVKNLIGKNVDPEEAYKIVHGETSIFKRYIPWVVGGAVALMVAPKLIRMVRN